ncbi:MAG TPA: hypothetical protein VIO57_15640, partial [Chloroflexota bacterium]
CTTGTILRATANRQRHGSRYVKTSIDGAKPASWDVKPLYNARKHMALLVECPQRRGGKE